MKLIQNIRKMLAQQNERLYFCGLDLRNKKDFELFKKTIDQIIGGVYSSTDK